MTTNIPELSVLVQVARDIVITARRQGGLESLTVKTVRRQVERDFALPEGTLDEGTSKVALREAVNAALTEHLLADVKTVEKRKRSPEESVEPEEEVKPVRPKKVKKETKKQTVKETPDEEETSGTSQKRKKKPRVVAKSKAMILSDSEDDQGATVQQPIASTSTSKAKKATKEATSKTAKTSKKATESTDADKSESERSVLSEEAAPKKSTKAKTKEGTKKTKTRKGKTDKAPENELSPDEATIKRLKTFVSACGLRKVWSKEFANLPLPKEQIARLKEILAEVGMTGRYSLEQAKAIKEKRDLARELDDVVEFERKAGASRGNRKKPQAGAKRIAELDTNSEISEGSDYDDDPKSPIKRSTASKSIMQYLANQSSDEE